MVLVIQDVDMFRLQTVVIGKRRFQAGWYFLGKNFG
jgi:hypothetical protein